MHGGRRLSQVDNDFRPGTGLRRNSQLSELGSLEQDFEQEEIALEQRAKQQQAKEKLRKQRLKEQKAREQADRASHQHLIAILKEHPKVKQIMGLRKCSYDEVVLHLQGKNLEAEGALFEMLRAAELPSALAAEVVELVEPACRTIVMNNDRRNSGVGSVEELQAGLGACRLWRSWGLRRVLAVLLILASFILTGVIVWEYFLADVDWEDGICNFIEFADRTCEVDDCEFTVEVARRGTLQKYVVQRWLPEVETSYPSGLTSFVGDAFRCCNDVGFDEQDCCQFWDEELYMFCDNWPHRTDSGGKVCPGGGWECLFKVKDGIVTDLKVYIEPDAVVEIVLAVCLFILGVVLCMGRILWSYVGLPLFEVTGSVLTWCCIQRAALRERRETAGALTVTGRSISNGDSRAQTPQRLSRGVTQQLDKARLQVQTMDITYDSRRRISSVGSLRSGPSEIGSPQKVMVMNSISTPTVLEKSDSTLSKGLTQGLYDDRFEGKSKKQLYKTIDGVPIRMAVAKMCPFDVSKEHPAFVNGDLISQLRSTATATDVFRPIVEPVPYGWPGEPVQHARAASAASPAGGLEFRPGTAPPKGTVAGAGSLAPAASNDRKSTPGKFRSSRRPRTRDHVANSAPRAEHSRGTEGGVAMGNSGGVAFPQPAVQVWSSGGRSGQGRRSSSARAPGSRQHRTAFGEFGPDGLR